MNSLTDQIHDRWFDIDAGDHDAQSHEYRLPFWAKASVRHPRDTAGTPTPFDRRLTIRGVHHVTISDRERIGIYSFNDLTYEEGKIVIRADPSVTITCDVGHCEVVIEELD